MAKKPERVKFESMLTELRHLPPEEQIEILDQAAQIFLKESTSKTFVSEKQGITLMVFGDPPNARFQLWSNDTRKAALLVFSEPTYELRLTIAATRDLARQLTEIADYLDNLPMDEQVSIDANEDS
jgi:hypothetical protein